jgi:hypothetical protein
VIKYIGGIDDNPENANKVSAKYLENAIKSLLSNQEIIPNVTKALGCGIK